jgi:hypothetical protein
MARFVALAEAGTHLIFAAELGRYKDSEIVLAEKVIPGLRKGMLCLADRLFPGLALWQKAEATGAHLLWRAKVGLNLKPERVLADGSWLATWKTPARGRKVAARSVHKKGHVHKKGQSHILTYVHKKGQSHILTHFENSSMVLSWQGN